MYYDKTNNIELATFNDVRKARPNVSFPIQSKLTEEDLNAQGIYSVVDNGETIDATKISTGHHIELINGVYTKVYDYMDKDIEVYRQERLQEVKASFNYKARKPRVEVVISNSRTIFVDGGRTNKDDFKEKWENMADTDTTTVRDADNNFVTDCTKDDLYAIYQAIYKNGEALYAWKWSKEAEINACTTLADLAAVVV